MTALTALARVTERARRAARASHGAVRRHESRPLMRRRLRKRRELRVGECRAQERTMTGAALVVRGEVARRRMSVTAEAGRRHGASDIHPLAGVGERVTGGAS